MFPDVYVFHSNFGILSQQQQAFLLVRIDVYIACLHHKHVTVNSLFIIIYLFVHVYRTPHLYQKHYKKTLLMHFNSLGIFSLKPLGRC